MANRPGEFYDSSSLDEIEEAVRIQRKTIARQEEQYEGERKSGTPEHELETLRREIKERQLRVHRGEELLAERRTSAPEVAPADVGLTEVTPATAPPAVSPSPFVRPIPSVPPVTTAAPPVSPPITSTTSTTPGPAWPGPITGTGAMITITDEMRQFAHKHFQGVTESVYFDQIRKLDEAAEMNEFALAELKREEQALVASGQRVPMRITDGIDKTTHDSELNLGVIEYLQANKPIFGIVPDPVATTTTPVVGPGSTVATPTAGAPAMVPRTKLPVWIATGAAITFPFSLLSKKVREAMVGRTKEVLGQDSSVPAPDPDQPKRFWTPKKVIATAGAGAALVYGANVIAHGINDGNQRPEDPSGELSPLPEDERGICLLDEPATLEQAKLAMTTSKGDPLKAIELAKQELRELYGKDCEADLVAQHEQIATEHIAELATGTPANVPGSSTTTAAPSTTLPESEITGSVFCEYDESGNRIIEDNGTPPPGLPPEIQDGQSCDVAPGQVADVQAPSGDNFRVIGR